MSLDRTCYFQFLWTSSPVLESSIRLSVISGGQIHFDGVVRVFFTRKEGNMMKKVIKNMKMVMEIETAMGRKILMINIYFMK